MNAKNVSLEKEKEEKEIIAKKTVIILLFIPLIVTFILIIIAYIVFIHSTKEIRIISLTASVFIGILLSIGFGFIVQHILVRKSEKKSDNF